MLQTNLPIPDLNNFLEELTQAAVACDEPRQQTAYAMAIASVLNKHANGTLSYYQLVDGH
jgi:hypothetical protein